MKQARYAYAQSQYNAGQQWILGEPRSFFVTAGSLPQVLCGPCGSEPARDGAIRSTKNLKRTA
ncbi:hypothetical protein ABH904_005528 [Pseudomonas frederiksbergensis]